MGAVIAIDDNDTSVTSDILKQIKHLHNFFF